MEIELKIEFPDGFQFPEKCDVSEDGQSFGKCGGCPFIVVYDEQPPTCFFVGSSGTCPFYKKGKGEARWNLEKFLISEAEKAIKAHKQS